MNHLHSIKCVYRLNGDHLSDGRDAPATTLGLGALGSHTTLADDALDA